MILMVLGQGSQLGNHCPQIRKISSVCSGSNVSSSATYDLTCPMMPTYVYLWHVRGYIGPIVSHSWRIE